MRLPSPLESPNSGSQSYGRGDDFKRRARDPGLFWWTILITFLLVLTAATWISCLYLFAFPEKALNYKLLAKLEKLDPLERFSVTSVPTGKSLTARELYKKFYHFDARQIKGANAKFKRGYLRNYKDEDPIFVKGSFRIEQVRKLGDDDYFRSGIVVQAYPVEEVEQDVTHAASRRIFPNAIFEFVFPAAAVPESEFKAGEELTVDTLKDFASVLNIERVGTDYLCFTALPILYGSYQINDRDALALAPPDSVNVDAAWPIFERNIQVKGTSTAALAP